MRDESVWHRVCSDEANPRITSPDQEIGYRFCVISLGVINGWKCRGREDLSNAWAINVAIAQFSPLTLRSVLDNGHQIGSVEHGGSRVSRRNIGEPFDVPTSEILRTLRDQRINATLLHVVSHQFPAAFELLHRNSRYLSVIHFHDGSPFAPRGLLLKKLRSHGFRGSSF